MKDLIIIKIYIKNSGPTIIFLCLSQSSLQTFEELDKKSHIKSSSPMVKWSSSLFQAIFKLLPLDVELEIVKIGSGTSKTTDRWCNTTSLYIGARDFAGESKMPTVMSCILISMPNAQLVMHDVQVLKAGVGFEYSM